MTQLRERANFTLTPEVKFELETIVPKSERSKFVDQAIASALLAEAKRKALEAIADAPAYDTGGEGSVEILRQIRRRFQESAIEPHLTTQQ